MLPNSYRNSEIRRSLLPRMTSTLSPCGTMTVGIDTIVVGHGIATWICFEWALSLFLELTAVAT